MDLATESRELNFRPKIVATLDGSLTEIAKNSRIKFRYLKKRREISHLIISSEPIYEAEARIFIVQSGTEPGSQCPVLLGAIKNSHDKIAAVTSEVYIISEIDRMFASDREPFLTEFLLVENVSY